MSMVADSSFATMILGLEKTETPSSCSNALKVREKSEAVSCPPMPRAWRHDIESAERPAPVAGLIEAGTRMSCTGIFLYVV